MSETLDYSEVRTKEMIQNLLNIGEVSVTFTKKDGTERIMKCTLNEVMIPTDKIPKNESAKKKNDDVQAVYDLEAAGWRSFAWNSIIEVSV